MILVSLSTDNGQQSTVVPSGWQFSGLQATLLCADKPDGAKAHSSGEINLPSSQPMLARIGVATDAIIPRRRLRFRPFDNAKLLQLFSAYTLTCLFVLLRVSSFRKSLKAREIKILRVACAEGLPNHRRGLTLAPRRAHRWRANSLPSCVGG